MKKFFTLVAVLTMVLASIIAFTGCRIKQKPNDPVDEPPKNETDTVIAPGDSVYYFADASEDAINSLIDSLWTIVFRKEGGCVTKGLPGDASRGIEVIIDIEDDTRPIIQKAQRLLERADEPDNLFDMRYVIYAHGGQIVIVCDSNPYTNHNVADYIIEDFVKKYLEGKETVKFPSGVVESGVIDLIALQELKDDVYIEEKWTEFEKEAKKVYGDEVGAEITKAFRTYYSMFSDNVVTWWADLYDPGMGAFYYTNSGRNTVGYLPGIESTGQVLNDLYSTGMRQIPGNTLPKIMQYQMAYYFKSLQDSDGFFYNPQLGKEGSDSYRIGRDQVHAITRMVEFGAWPTYTCVYNGKTYEGDGLTADQWWDSLVAEGKIDEDTPRPYVPKSLKDYEDYVKTGSLKSTSATSAASKVIAASTVGRGPSYFMSHADFDSWLKQWNPDAQPYSACSNITAARSLILPDSEALGPANAPGKWYDKMTLMEMVIAYLNSYINDKGLFGAYVDNGDPSAGCKFANTNGLMKSIGNYNTAGVPYPEPLKAVESCLICIMSDEPSTTNICEVYNVWVALSGVLNNVRSYGTEEQKEYLFGHFDAATGKQVGGRIYEVFARDGVSAVLNSYEKQKNYQCDDGGFNHSTYGNASGGSNNGGVPAGIGGVKESNIDAIGFGMHSIVREMCSSLGISDCVPVYTSSDWMRFIERVVELNPVIKDTFKTNIPKVYNFKNYESGSTELPDGLSLTDPEKFGSFRQVGASGMDGKPGVLQINKTKSGSGTGFVLQSPVNVSTVGGNMLTWEMDIKYSGVTARIESQLQLSENGKATNQRPFLILLTSDGTADGDPIYYSEYRNDGADPVKKFASGAVIGEWFKLKIEYYEGDGTTYRYKVYVNGNLIYTSNAIYSTEMVADMSKLPLAAGIENASISLNQVTAATLELDNIRLVQGIGTIDDLRVGKPGEEAIPDDRQDAELPPPPIPGGITTPAASDAITYDEEVSDQLQKTSSSSSVNKFSISEDVSGNGILYLDKPADGTVYVTQYPTYVEKDAQIAVYEVDIYASYTNADVLQISINGNGTSGPSNSPILILLSPRSMVTGSMIRYIDYAYDESQGKSVSKAYVDTDAKVGEWFRLRIEYSTKVDSIGKYTIEYSTYVNNKLVKTSDYIYSANIYQGNTSIPTASTLNSLSFSINSSNIGDFAMDNASFRMIAQNDYDFEEIVTPECVIGTGIKAPAGALTFDRYLEYMLSTNTVKINNSSDENKAEIVLVSGDRMMSLLKNDSSALEFIHYMKGKAVTAPSLVTYSTLMKLDTAPDSGEVIITFLDKDGNVGVKVGLSTDADGNVVVKAYKSTSEGQSDSGIVVPKKKVEAGEFFALSVVYAMGNEKNCLKVLINNDLVLKGDYYIGAPAEGVVTDAHITDINGFGVKLFGNIVGEVILDYSHFTVDTLPKDFVAENTNNGVIEYDKDYLKYATPSVSPSYAESNTWEILEENGNKFFAIHKTEMDTGGGSGVTVDLKVTKKEVDANMMVFEGKFKFANMTRPEYLQLVINNTSSSPLLGLLAPSSKADGSAINNQSKGISSGATTAKVGEWFTLRIEYWIAETDAVGNPTAIRYRYIVNDGIAAIGTTAYKTAMKLSDIKDMLITFTARNKGDLYMDDLSLSLVYTELPHEHSYENGRCECGAEDPDYVPTLTNGVVTFDDPSSYYFKTTETAYLKNSTVTEEDGNKYREIVKSVGYDKNNEFHITPTYVEDGATVAEVTFDIFVSSDAKLDTQIYFTVKKPVSVSAAFRSSPFLSTLMNYLTKGAWHTVKLVYAPTSFAETDGEDVFTVKIFIDGVHKQTVDTNYSVGKDNADIPTLDEIACFSFGLNNNCSGTFKIDDASFKLLKNASK